MSEYLTYHEKEPLQDHCGLVAAFCTDNTRFFLSGLAGLNKLQTRGYDGAGVFALDSAGLIWSYKNQGMITDVFNNEIIGSFKERQAHLWMFQTRYGTFGNKDVTNIQPIIRATQNGEVFAIIHNGQFNNHQLLDASDTVLFADILANNSSSNFETELLKLHHSQTGAWSLAVGTKDALYLLRDPHGIRPLVCGEKIDPGTGKTIWIAASETAALQVIGAKNFWEVQPNSVIKISPNGIETLYQEDRAPVAPCIFENVYLENGKSIIHRPRAEKHDLKTEATVDDFRQKCGRLLAGYESADFALKIDFAIGIPGTGIAGGQAYAEALSIPYLQAITDRKPMEIDARTFMTPNIEEIPDKISKHFYFEPSLFKNMRLVLIDDSLVRGNITKGMAQLLRSVYGVAEIHIRILCPPIDKPCHLGINTRQKSELIAAKYASDNAINEIDYQNIIEGIRQEIGVDSLKFLRDHDLLTAAGDDRFCLGCMLNHHPPV